MLLRLKSPNPNSATAPRSPPTNTISPYQVARKGGGGSYTSSPTPSCVVHPARIVSVELLLCLTNGPEKAKVYTPGKRLLNTTCPLESVVAFSNGRSLDALKILTSTPDWSIF